MMIIEHDLDYIKSDYNWVEVFKYANPEKCVDDEDISTESFTMDDISEIKALVDGQNDQDDWIAIFKLKDGRFAFIVAWCDFTGWGWQEGGQSLVSSGFLSLMRFGVGIEDRIRLGFYEEESMRN